MLRFILTAQSQHGAEYAENSHQEDHQLQASARESLEVAVMRSSKTF